MQTAPSHTPAKASRYALLVMSALAAHSLQAIDVVKQDNSDALNLATSWVGGSAPGSSDVALWDATVLSANTTALGADTSWAGIRVTSPGGAVSITTGNSLTLGTSGIDMSASTVDLSLAPSVILGGAQTWNVAASRSLSVTGGTSGAFALTKSGAGVLNLTTATGLSSLAVSAGTVNLSGANSASAANVATGATLNLLSGASLDLGGATLFLASTSGSAFFNLNGQTFANNITVNSPRSAYISSASGESTISGNVAAAGNGVLRLVSSTSDSNAKIKFTGAVTSGAGGIYSDNGNTEFTGSMTSSFFQVGRNTNSGRNTSAVISGTAAVTLTGALSLHNSTGTNSATITLKDTATITSSTVDLVASGNAITNIGVFNLDGGTLTTSSVKKTATAASGTFNFNGGLLKVKDNTSAATFFTGLTTANVLAGGANIDTNSVDVTMAQALVGSVSDGGLTKSGLGKLTLTGVNSYTGGTQVEAGILALTQDFTLSGANSFSINAGAAPVAGVDYGSIDFSGTSLVNGGTLDLIFTGTAVADTTYNLFNFITGTSTAGFSTISINGSYTVAPSAPISGIWSATTGGLNFVYTESTGDLAITSAIPEPASFAALAGLGILGFAATRRRRAA